MCPAICGDVGPTSLPYSFDFLGQLMNWLRVQWGSPKLYYSGQQVLLCSTRSQPQDCWSLLNLLLLDATGLSAAFPSTCQGMHPFVALEKSTLRRVTLDLILILLSGFPEAIGIPGLLEAIGLDAEEELGRNKRRHIHHCWSRLGHNSFLFFLILNLLRHCGAAYQAKILGAANGAEMADIEQMKKIGSTHHVWNFFLVNMSASWCLVSKRIWILGSKWILSNNQSRAALWVRETCLILRLRLLIIILITASLSKTYNMALGSECVVFGGMWSMFVGMTSVFLIGMGFVHVWLWHLPTGFSVALSSIHQFCSVRNEILQPPNPRERERGYRPCVNLHRGKWFQFL